MPSYDRTVEIAAPAAQVWAVTCDIEKWPSWSPSVTEVRRRETGPIRMGSSALVRQPRLRPATWTVVAADPDRTFVWETHATGYRITAHHVITPSPAGVTMRLEVVITGTLAPMLWALTGRTVRRYVDQEAAGLRQHCERPD